MRYCEIEWNLEEIIELIDGEALRVLYGKSEDYPSRYAEAIVDYLRTCCVAFCEAVEEKLPYDELRSFSWAIYDGGSQYSLYDYGHWGQWLTEKEIDSIMGYCECYKRDLIID